MRAGIVLVAALVGLGCGGGSLPGNGGSGGSGGGSGTPAACCPLGGESFASNVRARGFAAFEGRRVEAAFLFDSGAAISGVLVTSETSVHGGAFDLAFPPDRPSCSDTFSGNGAGAIFIDTNGDGACSPAADYLYAWMAFGAAGSMCATVDLTPQSRNCAGGFSFMLIEAARAVCPAIQDCLSCGSDGDGGAVVSCLI